MISSLSLHTASCQLYNSCKRGTDNQIKFMEQSRSWEADRRLSGQELFSMFWNPMIHWCIHKILRLNSVVTLTTAVTSLPAYLQKTNFIITPTSAHSYHKRFLCFRLPKYDFVCISHLSYFSPVITILLLCFEMSVFSYVHYVFVR
jgi:hypothetical protein